jgi:hypothetical protein
VWIKAMKGGIAMMGGAQLMITGAGIIGATEGL